MREFCENCDKEVEYEISIETEEFEIRGLKFEVAIKVPKCKTCGKDMYVQCVERENEIVIYDAYKKHAGLLTSSEIKEIRRKRKLSQADFAKLICIGEKDLSRYENGAIQSKSIDLLIRLVDKDDVFEKYLRTDNEVQTIYTFSYLMSNDKEEYKVKGAKCNAKPRFVCCNA